MRTGDWIRLYDPETGAYWRSLTESKAARLKAESRATAATALTDYTLQPLTKALKPLYRPISTKMILCGL